MEEQEYLHSRSEQYKRLLQDVRWQLKKKAVLRRDEFSCQQCGAKKVQLEVHHIRYVNGKMPWDYDGSDLITLCDKCHEKITDYEKYETLVPGGYFYHKGHRGVGIVEELHYDNLWFHACWTETDRDVDDNGKLEDHGRIYVEDQAYREDVRPATQSEIDDFWMKIGKYCSDNSIYYHFGRHLRTLLPESHPIRKRIKDAFNEAKEGYERNRNFLYEKYNGTLLVSDEYYASFRDERSDYLMGDLPYDVLPRAIFKVYKKQDIKNSIKTGKYAPREMYIFEKFDFSNFRSANESDMIEFYEYNRKCEEHKPRTNWP